MSPDLTRALHDAVDTGSDDAPFDVSALTGRIRRRRTVRRGVRGGVTLGAVGAVALGATFLRPPASVLPAARPDAAPGSCGSDIDDLAPQPDDLRVSLVRTDLTVEHRVAGPSDLGRLMGRAVLVQQLTVQGGAEPVTGSTRSSHEAAAQLALMELELARATEDGTLDARALEQFRAEIAEQRAVVDGLTDPVWGGTPRPVRIVVATPEESTVVAIDGADSDASYGYSTGIDGTVAIDLVTLNLVTCAQPGSAGGDPLPAGAYDVYAIYADGSTQLRAAGPWSLSLAPTPPPVTGLPAGFPADALPLVGGRLVSAERLGKGWAVQIAVDADDAVSEAARLAGIGAAPSLEWSESAVTVQQDVTAGDVPGWHVRIAPSQTENGEPTVVYTLTPLSR